MKRSIDAMKDKLWPLVNKARAYTDSENETIAEKYSDVADCLEQAIQSLIDAIDALES